MFWDLCVVLYVYPSSLLIPSMARSNGMFVNNDVTSRNMRISESFMSFFGEQVVKFKAVFYVTVSVRDIV